MEVEEQNSRASTQSGLAVTIKTVAELAAALLAEVEGLRQASGVDFESGLNIRDAVLRYEIDLIRSALRLKGNHQTSAARMLGVKLTTLNSKIKRYNIGP